MSVSYTWTTLLAALDRVTDETSQEYEDERPFIIGRAETRLVRDLNVEFFDFTDENLLAAAGDRQIVKPEDCIVLRSMQVQDNTTLKWEPVEWRSNDYVRLHGADESITGRPRFVCEHDEFEWSVSPMPDADYDIRARYLRRPEGLSASNAATWLSTNAGDALYAACLMECERFMKTDTESLTIEINRYSELLHTIRAELRRAIRSGDYNPFKPAASSA